MEYKIEDTKWYVLHTRTGYENVAKENLERVIEKNGLEDRIFDIVIPTETVIEVKNDKKVAVERKSMPTYLFVKMRYGDDIWHTVTRTRGITGFAGPKGRPLPLPEEEIIRMRLDKPIVHDSSLSEGDKVQILDGPLSMQIGTVNSVDLEHGKLKLIVEMFGRENIIETELDNVLKLDV